MTRLSRFFLLLIVLPGLGTSVAAAKQPTYSMEVIAVNSTELPGGPTGFLRAHPGDSLVVKIYLRNWSPNGERLNAYQMQLEPMDFTSGSSGNIKPVNYTEAREASEMNLANAKIEQSDPEWIFAGRQTVSIVDTRSAGYRWMSVLADTADARVHPQDDTKYYAGTVNMKISEDARGRFTLGYIEHPASSLLLDDHGVLIGTLEFELLTVVVDPDVLSVIAQLCGSEQVSLARTDINGDGKTAIEDLVQAVSLLNEAAEDTKQPETGTE